MTKRKKRSLVRGNKICLGGPPPRRKPVIDRNVPIDYETYLLGKRAPEADGDHLSDEICHPDEVGDVGAVVAMLDEVLGDVGGGDEIVGDDAGATDGTDATDSASAAGEESPS